MIGMLALGAMIGAHLLNPNLVLRSTDYPDSGWGKEHEGVSKVRVIVSPTGEAEKCEIILTTGDAKLDGIACAMMLKRGRFQPARDSGGVPTYGALSRFVMWQTGSTLRLPVNIDVEMQLSKMPPGAPPEATLIVLVAVDEAGGVGVCEGERPETLLALVGIVCRQLKSSGTIDPARDRDGKPVASVQSFSVKLSGAGARP